MSIKFPKHHIATSVVNRIMNIADELETGAETPQVGPVPNVPAALPEGPALSAALYQPTQPVTAGPELAEALTLKGLL